MITNQKIEVGEVQYSKFSQVLRFTVTANMEAIQTVEDITYRNDMTVEEIATKMGELLRKSIVSDYHRGGLRRKYD